MAKVSTSRPLQPHGATTEMASHYTTRPAYPLRRTRSGGSPRIQIAYQDESLCARSSANVFRLFQVATSPVGDQPQTRDASRVQSLSCSNGAANIADTSNSTTATVSDTSRLIARKALRYRNLLDRVQQVDLLDPAFDVAAFCGVTWSKRA